MLSSEEQNIADLFVDALRQGTVRPLPRIPDVEWQEGADPPDIVLIGSEPIDKVTVELATVLDNTRRFQQDTAAIIRAGHGGGSWSPTAEKDIHTVFRRKTKKYAERGIDVDWLLFHDNQGYFEHYHVLGYEGHRQLREACANEFATGQFSKIILQSTFLGQRWWSVIYSDDGEQIETVLEARLQEWRTRLCDISGIDISNIVVNEIGKDEMPEPKLGVLVYQDSGLKITLAGVGFDGHWKEVHGNPEHTGMYWRTWIPADTVESASVLLNKLVEESDLPKTPNRKDNNTSES